MMLVVVIFQRFARHVGGKRVVLVGKIGQRERHRLTPQMIKRADEARGVLWVTGARQPRFRANSLGRSGRRGNGPPDDYRRLMTREVVISASFEMFPGALTTGSYALLSARARPHANVNQDR